MFDRLGRWRQLGTTLTVMWTLAVIAYGWVNLPRAQQLPHNPLFLIKLSQEASSILFGRDAQAKPARATLVWSQTPLIVRMPNGTQLKFPAPTTDEQVAIVASEYRHLLDVEADEQRGPYLLAMLALWLAPYLLLVAGLAVSLIWRGYPPSRGRAIRGGHSPSSVGSALFVSHYVRQRTEQAPGEGDNRLNDGNTAGQFS